MLLNEAVYYVSSVMQNNIVAILPVEFQFGQVRIIDVEWRVFYRLGGHACEYILHIKDHGKIKAPVNFAIRKEDRCNIYLIQEALIQFTKFRV